MSKSPRYVYLLAQSDQMEDESFNSLQSNLSALNVRKIAEDVYLIFSHESQADLAKRVFSGVTPDSKAILALISDSASMPE